MSAKQEIHDMVDDFFNNNPWAETLPVKQALMALQPMFFPKKRRRQIPDKVINDVRKRYEDGETQASIGARYGIDQAHVSQIVRFKTRRHTHVE